MKRKKDSELSQRQKFIQSARELEADESDEAFDASLRKIGSARVVSPKRKAKPSKGQH